MITKDAIFKTRPRMHQAGFQKVLKDKNSPFQENAIQIYNYIEQHGHDPAVWLAIAAREHQYGTDPNSVFVRNDTKSWTNARSVRHPEIKKTAKIITDAVRKSNYVKYASQLDSIIDGVYRVDDPTYAYANAKTIQEVISIWAPAEDQNNPESYASFVAALVSQWQELYPVQGENTMIKYEWLPSGNFGYPRGTTGRGGATIDRIIIHTTEGGYRSSIDWLRRTPRPGDEGSSTNFIINKDGTEGAILVDPLNAAWTAGNGEFNRRGINIEMEGYASRGGFSEGLYNEAARLSAEMIKRFPTIKPDRTHIIGHAEVPNQDHTDPGPHWDWNKFINLVKKHLNDIGEPVVSERYFPETKHHLAHGFFGYWHRRGESDGLEEYGYPISEEFKDHNGVTVQYFQRARFEFQPNIANNPWGVVKGLVGQELSELNKARQDFPDAFSDKPE